LENDTLTFEYIVDPRDTKLYTVIGLDFASASEDGSALVHSSADIALRTIEEDGYVTVTKPESVESSEGFTKARSYITDLAGNPISNEQPVKRFYIDCESPYAAKVSFDAELNNGDIKALRGVTELDPKDPRYGDPSDLYLGAGDMLGFNLYFNEQVFWEECEGYFIDNAYVVTNLKYDNGTYLELDIADFRFLVQASSLGDQFGRGRSNGLVSRLSTSRLPLPADSKSHLTVDDPSGKGEIKITAVHLEGSGIADSSGNLASSAFSKPQESYKLDTAAPVYSLGDAVQTGGANSTFTIPFIITDNEGGSGVEELPASLRLSDPNGSSGRIQYAVSAFAAPPAKASDWHEGIMGSDISFIQTSDWQYLHVKPDPEAHFDLGPDQELGISFKLQDYAGNRADTATIGVEGVALDSAPPTVTSGDVNRSYDNSSDEGTISVVLRASDASGIDSIKYQWLEPGSSESDIDEDAWISAVRQGGKWTASGTVETGEVFRQDLWVYAEDGAGNAGVTGLGCFSYSLESTDYALDWSPAIMTAVKAGVSSLEDGGALLFDVRLSGDGAHYIHFADSEESDVFAGSWQSAEFSDEDGYTFTELEDADDFLEDYTGNVNVTVYSGSADMFEELGEDGEDGLTVADSAVTEEFTLRQSPAGNTAEDVFSADIEDIFTPASAAELARLTNKVTELPWTVDSDERNPANTDGLRVTIDLGGDRNGWNYEDIDWKNSFISVYSDSDPDAAVSQYDLITDRDYCMLCATGSGPVQTLTLPEIDLEGEGVDYANLFLILARHSAPDAPYAIELYAGGEEYVFDGTEPGKLELQHLGRQYEDEEGRYYDLAFDPSSTIYIPTESTPAALSVEALRRHIAYDNGEPYTEYIPFALYDEYVAGVIGAVDVVAWNADDPDEKISLACSWFDYSNNNGPGEDDPRYIYMYEDGSAALRSGKRLLRFGDTTDASTGTIGVEAGKDNTIALQIVCANGSSSEIYYITVHPVKIGLEGEVSIETPYDLDLRGSASVATVGPDEAYIVFSPDSGYNAEGLELFAAWGYLRTDGSYGFDSGIPMTMQGDGSWRAKVQNADFWSCLDHPDDYLTCGIINPMYDSEMGLTGYSIPMDFEDGYIDLTHNGNLSDPPPYYVVYASDQYGNKHVMGITDWAVVADRSAPLFTSNNMRPLGSIDTASDGTYTATFELVDDSFYSWDSYSGEIISRPVTLEFFFDSKYAEAAGKPAARLTLTGIEDGFVWKDEDGNGTGIYEVTAEIVREGTFNSNNYYGEIATYAGGAKFARMIVTVKGAVSPEVTAPMPMTLFAKATDAHGNTNGWTMPDADFQYFDDIMDEGDYARFDNPGVVHARSVSGVKPKVTGAVYKRTGEGDDMALYVNFSAPVRPLESWIRSSDGEPEGYSTEWHDAFPICKDGSWNISYSDPFGNTYTEELALDGVFGEYGYDLSFSTLDWVSKETGVTVTAVADDDSESLSGRAQYSEGGAFEDMPEATATFTQNVHEYQIVRSANGKNDILRVHIGNIVDGAPEETLYFRMDEFSQTYKEGTQPRGETFGNVTVSYRTDRETSPVGATEKTFREGDDDSFSFRYYDAATDKQYTINGSLGKYGISIGHFVPYEDEEAPSIDLVSVWKQRADGFIQADAFPGSADDDAVKASIAACGTAQSYDFVVNASDYSRWKVIVKSSLPGSVSFENTESDDIDGVAVSGNNVLVTNRVAGDFYIVVVDSASVDTAAAADNFSAVKIPYGAYRFDNEAPEIDTVTASLDLYTKVVYIGVSDTDDAGHQTEGVTVTGKGVIPNSDAGYEAYQYKMVFFDNEEVSVTAADAAGNIKVKNIVVTGIDVEAPELTVTWSPCFTDGNGPDQYSPAAGPVRTNVTAHISSSKDILRVRANEGDELVFTDGRAETEWGSVEYTSQMVTVRFTTGAEVSLDVTVTAPNKKSNTATVRLAGGVIDKEAPAVSESVTPMKRSGAEAPYAERHRLSFSEEVFCMGEGPAGRIYSAAEPLELVLYRTDEIRELVFNDRAGNITVYTVKPSAGTVLDNRAPELELELDDEASATSSDVRVTVVSDEYVRLSSSDSSVSCGTVSESGDGSWTGTVSASENGTFRINAADRAGNTASAVFTVNNIDKTLPLMSFDKSTYGVLQDSDPASLRRLLDSGVTVWDNVGVREGSLSYDMSAVELSTPGVYEVVYSVEDLAGNTGEKIRFVKVIDKNLPMLTVDGEVTEEGGTFSLKAGTHILGVSGLKDGSEPYTVQVVKGKYARGQMKSFHEGIEIAADGSIELTRGGFYTVLVTTQSRQTYRTLLYVEQ
ncbi:MAG: hypothetical protein II803_03210, partial [Firmicutes bacterium]|nr:hypothetical protein [Bacillota bacterium]